MYALSTKRGNGEDAFDGRHGISMRVVPRVILIIIRPEMQETVSWGVFLSPGHEALQQLSRMEENHDNQKLLQKRCNQ